MNQLMDTRKPTHDEIARRAQEIWRDRYYPVGSDTEIWLEAEKQLGEEMTKTDLYNSTSEPPGEQVGSEENTRETERIKGETAAESMVEYNVSPAVSDEEAVRMALNKDAVRSRKSPKRARSKEGSNTKQY